MFNPKKIITSNESPDFLNQSKSFSKDNLIAEKESKEARLEVLRILNALKIISPLVNVISEKSGTAEEMSANFTTLINLASDFSAQICKKLNVDIKNPENYWIRNSFERLASECLKDIWIKHGSNSIVLLENALLSLEDILNTKSWEELNYDEVSPESKIKISLIRAMTPIILASKTSFDFFRKDSSTDLSNITELIFNTCKDSLEKIAPKHASPSERATIFSLTAVEAGELYATIWKSIGKKTVEKLSKLSDNQLNKLLEKNPDGLDLNEINDSFVENFHRTIVLTNRLCNPGAGKIKERIIKK